MSRRRRANTAGVSLFPFLDVLVCTMGSLILLLLVATSRIRAAAVEKAKQAALQERANSIQPPTPAPEPIVLAPEPELEPELDPTTEWKTRIEQLTDEQDALRNQLAQSKSRLASAQSAVMKTKVKAASTEDRLKAIRTQQEEAAAERQRLQAEIDSLQSDLTDAEQRLTKAVERQQTAKSKFAFMPFDGRTGTTKRPIIIECTEDCIRFLPEDVRLSPADVNGFTAGFNPLLKASRVLVDYWTNYEKVHSTDANTTKDADSFETGLATLNDKEHEPYVLLLIRPNGTRAFGIATFFLSQLKVPHGYELVTDDMEIDSSNHDPKAKKVCQDAITQFMSERDAFLQEMVRNPDLRQFQIQLDPTARTFVWKETNDSPTGFSRPKSSASSARSSTTTGSATDRSATKGTSTGGSAINRSSTNSPSADAPATNNTAHTSRSSETTSSSQPNRGADGVGLPDADDSNIVPRTGNTSSPAHQPHAGRQQAVQTGRLQSRDEPPEEPLSQPSGNRYENDDSKPFPFSGERTKVASSKDGPSGVTASKSNPARPISRPSNDPRDANNSTNGSANNGNLSRLKRRYLMPRSGIGLEKAIPIRISSRRVMIGGEYEIPVESGVKTQSLIDRVLIAMDRVQSGWPNAAEGYHWVPTIKYEVVPGGEQVHQRLNSALFDLGLVSNVEYLDSDPDAVKPSRETSRSRATTPVEQAASLPHGGGAR